jgi:hypothetical protein
MVQAPNIEGARLPRRALLSQQSTCSGYPQPIETTVVLRVYTVKVIGGGRGTKATSPLSNGHHPLRRVAACGIVIEERVNPIGPLRRPSRWSAHHCIIFLRSGRYVAQLYAALT